jgi:hypothetical protein
VNIRLANFGLTAAFIASSLLPTAAKAQTVSLFGGETKVVLSSGFVSALGTLGVKPGAVGPGSLYGGVATFPITLGVADLALPKVEVGHAGGLSLTAGSTKVELLNFDIEVLDSSPVLTGIVTDNGAIVGRVPLFTIASIGNVYQPNKETLSIQDVSLTLTSTAASALNSIFNVKAFSGGFGIGTASTFTFVQLSHCK